MTSLELLQEIDAWLSFNNSPSKEQIRELRNDIKKHISEQLRIHDVSVRSEQLVCRICGTNEEMGKDYDLCYVCWKKYHPDAND